MTGRPVPACVGQSFRRLVSVTALEPALLTVPRHLLRLRNLLRCHLSADGVAILRCIRVTCHAGKTEPNVRAKIVLRHGFAVEILPAETLLRRGKPLRCGQSIPLDCFPIVLRGTPALLAHEAETVLRGGNSLCRRQSKPLDSFRVVLSDALPLLI